MSIDSRSDIPFEAEEAYGRYKADPGLYADFVKAAGGLPNASAIALILGAEEARRTKADGTPDKRFKPKRNTEGSGLTLGEAQAKARKKAEQMNVNDHFGDLKSLFEPPGVIKQQTQQQARDRKKESSISENSTSDPLPTISNGQRTTERTPPIIALLLSFGIGLAMFVTNVYSTLGILLISFTVGFHVLSLFWLEILTLPRFKRRKDVAWTWGLWSFLLVISILSSIMIIGIDFIPTTNSNEYSLMLNGTNTIHPFMKIALFFQITSNLFLISSMKNVTKFRNKLIKSPWTIASLVSLISVSLPLIYIENTSWTNDLTWTQDLMLINFSAIIIGSSAMIYGRSANSNLLTTAFSVILPSLLGFAILLQLGDSAELRELPIIIAYLVFPLFLNVTTWIIPSNVIKINSKDNDTQRSKLMISNTFIFIILVSCIIYLSFQSNRMYLTLTPLLFSYTIFSREHTTRLGGSTLKIHTIIGRNTLDNNLNNKKVKLKFSILGAVATGKTSFTAALWTLLTTRELRNIWWSPSIRIEDHKILDDHIEANNGKNLKALAKRGGYKDEGAVEQMLEARIAINSCKHWIDKVEFPTPIEDTPFPFTAQSFGRSERNLDNLKTLLVDPDNRALPDPTTAPGKVSITMNFHADVEIIQPSFLWGRTLLNKDKREICEIELDIETWDLGGESFAAAIYHTREFLNSDSERLSQSIMKPVKQSALNASGFEEARAADVEAARELFLHSSHTFLIVDSDDLLDGGDKKGVEEYIRLMQKIHKKGDGELERLQILLNKADHLLIRNDESSRLDGWWDMNNRKKSESILNDATNFALNELRAAGMDVGVGFTCTFGGLITDIDESGKPKLMNDGKPSMLAPYPMIPVNVLEPFIDVILGSNLICDDI